MLDVELLDTLYCPDCFANILYDDDARGFACPKCGAQYPARDGGPVMPWDGHERDGDRAATPARPLAEIKT